MIHRTLTMTNLLNLTHTTEPARTHVLRSGERAGLSRVKVSKYHAMSDEYQEQRRTAENSEARRCYFDMSSSKTQGFLGRREALPLIISGKNSETARKARWPYCMPKQCSGPGK